MKLICTFVFPRTGRPICSPLDAIVKENQEGRINLSISVYLFYNVIWQQFIKNIWFGFIFYIAIVIESLVNVKDTKYYSRILWYLHDIMDGGLIYFQVMWINH